jgi:hypothetical protein
MWNLRVKQCLHGAGFAILAILSTTAVVQADATSVAVAAPGTIVGIVTNGSKLPVAGVTVTAIRDSGGGIRATLSGSDGIYSFPDLPPGTWSLTTQIEGSPDLVIPGILVVANKATRHDIAMNVPVSPAAPALASAPTAAPARTRNKPPNPNMGVEDYAHRKAAKSSSIQTDSFALILVLPPSARSSSQGLL